jgi:two-component sensor histidine kinase
LNFLHLFSIEDFMPHGHCFLWQPGIMTLHIVSDTIVAIAYYSIPFGLLYFVVRRPDVLYRWMAVLFGIFILACGTTHIMSIVVLWTPVYWLDGSIKALTAVASIGTAVLVWREMPRALAMPSSTTLQHEVDERTRQLQHANAELRATIQAKETLLQELHHRVRNNLQIVSALLAMQAKNRPELVPALQESSARIQSMGRIHDQLHMAPDASSLDVGEYLKTLVSDLTRIYGRDDIQFEFQLPRLPLRISLDAATAFVLVLNEGLSNVFKHAYPPGKSGKVVVAVEDTQGKPTVTITDDGAGFDVDRKQQGGGMDLVHMLARQVGLALKIDGRQGTRFAIGIPKTLVATA